MAISMGETVLLLRAAKYLYRMHAMHLYHQQHRERCLKYMLCVCKVYVQKGIHHIYMYAELLVITIVNQQWRKTQQKNGKKCAILTLGKRS